MFKTVATILAMVLLCSCATLKDEQCYPSKRHLHHSGYAKKNCDTLV
jgi:hypothetical protein